MTTPEYKQETHHWSANTLCECGNAGAKPRHENGISDFCCPTCWEEMQPCEGSTWITAADLNANYSNE
jgi:hypothetical protein